MVWDKKCPIDGSTTDIDFTVGYSFDNTSSTGEAMGWCKKHLQYFGGHTSAGPDTVGKIWAGSFARRISRPAETVISNLQSGHGFTKWSAAGTQADDTTTFIRGSQSMKQTTDGAGSTIQSRKTITSTDMTGKQFKILVNISDITNLASIRFRASSDTFTNYFDWQIATNSSIFTDSNTWIPITLSFGQSTSTGAPNRAAIINIAVLCTDKNNGTTVNVNWGGISTVAEPSGGVVTFRFDDGWGTQYTNGKAVLDTYNYKATYFVIPDYAGTANYMTVSQMRELQKLGNDIACHHQTDLSTMDTLTLEKTIQSIKSWMLTNGFSEAVDYIAYPNGGINETMMPYMKRYFRAGFLVTTNPGEQTTPSDPYRIRIMNVTASTTTTSITNAIATANTNKEWLILMLHQIVASGATGNTQYNKADLQTVVDYCNTNNISVKTVTEVLG